MSTKIENTGIDASNTRQPWDRRGKGKRTQLLLFLVLATPRGQSPASTHFVVHPERARRTWAEETNSLRPATAILTNCIALW
jgi:hypothetical protein